MNRRSLVALLAGGAVGGAVRLLAAQATTEIHISAGKFEYRPDTVTAPLGKPVTFVLTSRDRIHGFKMPNFGLRTDIVPGQETRVTINPDKAGAYVFFCDVFCGDGHEDMAGTLIVKG